MYGDGTVTGYERQRSLKNMSAEEVQEVFQTLRDSLGRKTPTHNEIGIGVVEQKSITVQGVWRNTPDLRTPELLDTKRKREEMMKKFGMQGIIAELGTAGAVCVTQKLLQRRTELHEKALRELPKVERVMPTE